MSRSPEQKCLPNDGVGQQHPNVYVLRPDPRCERAKLVRKFVAVSSNLQPGWHFKIDSPATDHFVDAGLPDCQVPDTEGPTSVTVHSPASDKTKRRDDEGLSLGEFALVIVLGYRPPVSHEDCAGCCARFPTVVTICARAKESV